MPRLRLLLLLVGAVGWTGCENPTVPSPPLLLELHGPSETVAVVDDRGRLECSFELSATAEGGPADAYVEWISGRLSVLIDDETVFGARLTYEDLLDFWGSDRVGTGRTVSGRLENFALSSNPWALRFVFRYELSTTGEARSDSFEVACVSPDSTPTGS